MTDESQRPNDEAPKKDTAAPGEGGDREEATSSARGEGEEGSAAEEAAESYRSVVRWLSEEIESLEQTGRERLQGAVEKVKERFPTEERQRIASSAEEEIRDLLGELQSLGNRIRKTGAVSRFEEAGTEVLRTGASKVRAWAEKVEETLARAETEAASEEAPPEKPPNEGEEPASPEAPEQLPQPTGEGQLPPADDEGKPGT